jgi:hypothetical protein
MQCIVWCVYAAESPRVIKVGKPHQQTARSVRECAGVTIKNPPFLPSASEIINSLCSAPPECAALLYHYHIFLVLIKQRAAAAATVLSRPVFIQLLSLAVQNTAACNNGACHLQPLANQLLQQLEWSVNTVRL